MPRFDGQRIALLESRKATDLATLVRRFGGTPLCVPSVREVLREGDFRPRLQALVHGEYDVLAVLTAAAFDALVAESERLQMLDAVVAALGTVTIAARGPKPLLALRRRGLTARVTTDKPHTSDDLLSALRAVHLPGTRVLVLHYGERSEAFSTELAARGATVDDLSLYDWALPDDFGPLQALVRDTVERRVDAMLFTSQVQFRHLLIAAGQIGLEEPLVRALRDRVIVGSVGPVCSRVLRASGIVPDVMPHSPNGASLIQAVAEYVSMFDFTGETS